METKRKSVKLNATMKNDVFHGMLNQFDVKHKIKEETIAPVVEQTMIDSVPFDIMVVFDKYKGRYMDCTHYFTIYYNKQQKSVRLEKSIPSHETSINLDKIKRTEKNELLFKYMEYYENREKFKDTVNHILVSVNTTKQLIEKLPIAEYYLTDNDIMISGQLIPVSQIKFITDMLK